MSDDTLREEIRSIIAEITEQETSAIADDTLLRDLGVDSMQAIEIITDIEKRYKIKIAESEYRNISTLSNVTAFLKTKLAEKA
jgi:acyl carrier protein